MKAMDKLTFTMENYLEAVYELSREDGSARLTDIAARLEVTKYRHVHPCAKRIDYK